MIRILLIETDPDDQDVLRMILPEDFSLTICCSDFDVLSALKNEAFHIVLLSVTHSGRDGLALLQEIQTLQRHPPVLVITDAGDDRTIRRAILLGASNYLIKPFSLSDVRERIAAAVDSSCVQADFSGDESDHAAFRSFIGNSSSVRNVKRLIGMFGRSDSSVLITGESGTGKELAARILHECSPYASGRFMAVNCGALPESLLETELFGSERGAFTGAVSRPGLFELADGGTVFLDEIGEMSRSAQVKLLRVLESRETSRVGSARKRSLNLRVIAATNIDIRQAVESGAFRRDLFYRINTLPVHLPPLRERREDIPLLVAHFLQESCSEEERPDVHPSAAELLLQHPWPGNVRELRNVIKRAILLMKDGVIVPESVLFS